MKSTLAATLLIFTAFAAARAQDASRDATFNATMRERSGALRATRAKASAAGERPKGGAQADAVDQLIERNELAEGGVAKLKIRSRIMRGRVEISTSVLPGSYEYYEKRPDKKLEVVNAPSGQFIHAADGARRWVKSPWNLSVTMPASETDSGDAGASDARPAKWRRYFTSASIRGRASVDGREMVVLAATLKVNGRPVVMYFDAETWLLRKQEFPARKTEDENPIRAVHVDSYAVVDGVKIPSLYREVYEQFTLTFRIFEVKHNVPIDDALFRDPNGK